MSTTRNAQRMLPGNSAKQGSETDLQGQSREA